MRENAGMFDRDLDCLAPPESVTLPVFPLRPADLDGFLSTSPDKAFLQAGGFQGCRR